MNVTGIALASALLLAGTACAFAASEADYRAAYAAAEAADKEAGAVRNQWTTTASTLAAARKAVRAALAPHFKSGKVALPGAVWLVESSRV